MDSETERRRPSAAHFMVGNSYKSGKGPIDGLVPPITRRRSSVNQVVAGSDYLVSNNTYRLKSTGDPTAHLKTSNDGETILIPQPSAHPDDPLNWSWGRKHCVLVALAMGALLTDWGMTWGTTLFEAQAADWHMSVPDVANSISGGIFMQGPGGVLAVPLIQRYGRLPVLFWSQLLSCAMVIGAALSSSYAGFTACRTLQGFFNTAPQVIGLSMINDIFFFHERTRKINIWAWCFLCGPYFGPFFSGLILIKLSWRSDFLVLAGMYGLSTLVVALLGDETLFDRDLIEIHEKRDRSPLGRFKLLIGVTGVRESRRRPSLWSITKHMLQLAILPYLLLPTLIFLLLLTMWTIGITTSITQFVKPPPYSFSNLSVAFLYLSPFLGTVIAEVWGHYFNEYICKRYIRIHSGIWRPEHRLWGSYPAVLISASGLILLGQTLQHGLPWPGIAIGWAMNAFGLLAATTVVSAYVLDCFPDHAAGASSWINMWRTTGGFCVSYFQLRWVAHSGPAVTFGVQAAIIGAGFLAVVGTQVWGPRWRVRYPVPEPEN